MRCDTLPVTIRPIALGGADLERFLALPARLYARDPCWVPPLLAERRDFFNPRKNPYFEHAKVQLFLAERGGQVVGRISAQVDDLVHAHMAPDIGQWGCFECENDPAVAHALIQAAETWLRQHGMGRALGPISLSMWDEPGTLISGFETPPRLFMGHHRPYYPDLITQAGYAYVKDVYAWTIDVREPYPERIQKIIAPGHHNQHIRLRPLSDASFAEDVAIIIDILNEAWSDNWGFTPLTPSEIAYAIKAWKKLTRPGWVQITEYDGVPVGFIVTLANFNEIIADLNGRLLPLGWIKFLWRMYRKQTQWVRVPIMGLRHRIQTSKQGATIVMMMIEKVRQQAVADGVLYAECSWILDDNNGMNNILKAIGCVLDKTYRIYQRTLSTPILS